MSNSQNCPICEQDLDRTPDPRFDIGAIVYACPTCGTFCVSEIDEVNQFKSPNGLDQQSRTQLSALLLERKLKELPYPNIIFEAFEEYKTNKGFPLLHFDELMRAWPNSISERMDRILFDLSLSQPKPGHFVHPINAVGKFEDAVCFSESIHERYFYLTSLCELGFLTGDPSTIKISSQGWARVHELAGGAERRRNPAFVAMWFGGKDQNDISRMTSRFNDVIRPACRACGWNPERVDSTEYNDSVIDRILQMIRVSPFVVAGLSDENDGVYYEAGFARGQNVQVIYLVKEGTKVHFDVTGVNHVRWNNETELKTRLENRILGTMGKGPHK